MKLKHVAAFVMLLLAVGCSQQPTAPATPAGDSATSAPETDATSSTVAPETDVLATKTVSFNVTGMK